MGREGRGLRDCCGDGKGDEGASSHMESTSVRPCRRISMFCAASLYCWYSCAASKRTSEEKTKQKQQEEKTTGRKNRLEKRKQSKKKKGVKAQ